MPEPATLDKVATATVAFAFRYDTFWVVIAARASGPRQHRALLGLGSHGGTGHSLLGIYAAYLHARATAGWEGSVGADQPAASFSAMTFNFFVVNIVISGLHSYAGAELSAPPAAARGLSLADLSRRGPASPPECGLEPGRGACSGRDKATDRSAPVIWSEGERGWVSENGHELP